MRALCIVDKGIEQACSKEIKEILGVDSRMHPGAVTFATAKKDIARFMYLTQSSSRVLLLLKRFKAYANLNKTLRSLKSCLASSDTGRYIKPGDSIRVDCLRVGEHDFSAMDIESEAGAAIIGQSDIRASMKRPNIVFFVYIIDDVGYVGVDITRRDLSKRKYKIFGCTNTIKGTVAFALLKYAGIKRAKSILDPFCGAGTIPLEAAHYQSRASINFHDKEFSDSMSLYDVFLDADKSRRTITCRSFGTDHELRHIKSAQKNTKVAGIENVQFSNCDVGWLDTKFDKHSTDIIASQPPPESRRTDLAELKKAYDELFYQARYVLKKSGRIALLLTKTDLAKECASKQGFKNPKSFSIWSGKQEYILLVWQKEDEVVS